MMVKLVCLLLSVSLLDFGTAELFKAPSRSPDYKPSLYSQQSSEVVSNTSPEDVQNQLSQIRHQNPNLELDLAIEIKPYFLGNRYEAEENPHPSGISSRLFPVFPWYQVKETPAAQRNEKADTATRKSVNLDLNSNPAIALALSLRIEDVNQIWGYTEDKSTKKPECNTSETHNVGNQYTPILKTGNENSSQDGSLPVFNKHPFDQYKSNDTINPLNPTSVNINTDDDSLDKEDFLNNDPGEPIIVETGNGNPFQVGSPSGLNIQPFDKYKPSNTINPVKPTSVNTNTDDDYADFVAFMNIAPDKPSILETGNENSDGLTGTHNSSTGSWNSSTDNNAFLDYGLSKFEDFLNHKQTENKERKDDIFNGGLHNDENETTQHETTGKSNASSQSEPKDKTVSSNDLKKFEDFLNRKMDENKREKHVTDTELNNVKSLKQYGTTTKSSASSQSTPDHKAVSSNGLEEFEKFLKQKMDENKREKYVTDTEINNDHHKTRENQFNVGTHDSHHNEGKHAYTEIDERMAFPE